MRRKAIHVGLALLSALALAACDNVGELDDNGGGDGGTDTLDVGDPPPIDALDIIFVVDDSASMAQEQEILATSVFHLVATLTTPRVDWPYPAVDDVRIAIVDTNMGLSADGVSGDGWWPDNVPDSCVGFGDDGKFQEVAASGIRIQDDTIPCWGAPGECPPDWECAEGAAGGTFCQSPNPGASTPCPGSVGDYAQTTAAEPNGQLALQVACLASQGTGGCGFEQQLAAAARAVTREDQAWFFRDNAGLGIVVVSDENDCSMADNAGMFATDEVADMAQLKVNIACGENPQFLHPPSYFVDRLAAAKGGRPEYVYYAALVGVPPVAACQGPGIALGDCLAQEEMQLVPGQPNAPDDNTWFYEEACSRFVGDTEVTHAYPGRRFVELAQEMGPRSFVYSICNEDWMPAMEAFAAIMADAVDEN